MYQEGQTATHKDGRRIIFQGGQWRLLRGEAAAPTGAPGGYADAKLTEDQGKAQTYGRLMATAERQYDDAVRAGYDYGSPINALADFIETPAPVVGAPLGGLAPLLRGPEADKAVGARRAWLDAQLKAMTGAGQSQSEMVENPKTYFPQFGEGEGAAANKRQMRSEAYAAARRRAGPAGADLPAYPQQLPPETRAAHERLIRAGRIDDSQPYGSQANPYVARDEATANNLPRGSYVIVNGRLGVVD